MSDKVRCPKCGNKYILKDISIYEISDEGAYDWAKPMITECNLICTECGYEPPFDNHVDRVEILEGEKSRTCPECGAGYDNGSYGHSYDAIEEHGKCTECLGFCPYCDELGCITE